MRLPMTTTTMTTMTPPLASASAALLLRDATTQSPVTQVYFRGQRVHVKRDDIFHLAGNKMRKLHWFVAQDDEFYRDAHLVSFGGTQSNAMLAIAQLAHAKRVPFTYYSRGLALRAATTAATATTTVAPPSPLVPQSNLALALALGMEHVELAPEQYQALAHAKDLAALPRHELPMSSPSSPTAAAATRTVFVPQGAACPHAQHGLALLAHELNAYMRGRAFAVVVPCGTGTTALYLAQHLDPCAELFAVPCVGDAAYLTQQLAALIQQDASLRDVAAASAPSSSWRMPTVITPPRKARFGRLSWPLFTMHEDVLAATGIAFDLNYGAFAWHTMFDAAVLPQLLAAAPSRAETSCREPRELLYVHTGGVSGNATMLARYAAKWRSTSTGASAGAPERMQ